MNNYVSSKWVYSLIGLVLIAMIVWIIAGTSESDESNEVNVAQETYTMEASIEENNETQPSFTGYYLIKAEDGIVKVYWVDESGKHLHLETSIPYALLSVEDQELLDEGMKLEGDEELASFLENYDS